MNTPQSFASLNDTMPDFELDPIMLLALLIPPVGSIIVGIPTIAYYIIQVRIRGKTDPQDVSRNTCLISAVAVFLCFATSAVGYYAYSAFVTVSSAFTRWSLRPQGATEA